MLFNKAKFVKNLGKWKMPGQPHTLPLIFKNSFFVADNCDSRWFFDFLAVLQEGNSAVVSTYIVSSSAVNKRFNFLNIIHRFLPVVIVLSLIDAI
jgi:hypothetical protein